MMAKNTAGWSTNSNPMVDLFNGIGGLFGLPSLGGGGSAATPPTSPPPANPPAPPSQPSMPQWIGGLAGSNNVFGTPLGQLMMRDMMASSLASAQYEPSQTTTDMMAAGRPSFNWGLMGAVGPLAGALPQPEYTTPPPEFSPKYWRDYQPSGSSSGTSYGGGYGLPMIVGGWGS